MVRLSGVEFRVLREFGREICLSIDGVHGAHVDTGRAIDAFLGMDHDLVVHFVKTGDRTHLHTRRAIDAFLGMDHDLIVHLVKTGDRAHLNTIGELASGAFIGDDVSHKIW